MAEAFLAQQAFYLVVCQRLHHHWLPQRKAPTAPRRSIFPNGVSEHTALLSTGMGLPFIDMKLFALPAS